MVMVLDTVGLPAEDVTIILAVDWLLDRLVGTTSHNVFEINVGLRMILLKEAKWIFSTVETGYKVTAFKVNWSIK